MFYFGLFVYLATVTVIFANPLPHGSNDWIAAKKLIDTRQVSAEDPSDTDSFGTDTGVETEPVKNLDSSTSSQNALVVADLVRSSDNGCISNADSDHLLDDNIQQGNTFRRRTTPNFCPTVTQLVPPRIPGRRFKITPSSQPSKGQTHITRPTGEEPCAGLTTRMLPENLELVTCGGPEIGDPRSRLIDMVAHCVKGGVATSVPPMGPFDKNAVVEKYCCNHFVDEPFFWMSFRCLSLGTEPRVSPSSRWSTARWHEWSQTYLDWLHNQ